MALDRAGLHSRGRLCHTRIEPRHCTDERALRLCSLRHITRGTFAALSASRQDKAVPEDRYVCSARCFLRGHSRRSRQERRSIFRRHTAQQASEPLDLPGLFRSSFFFWFRRLFSVVEQLVKRNSQCSGKLLHRLDGRYGMPVLET